MTMGDRIKPGNKRAGDNGPQTTRQAAATTDARDGDRPGPAASIQSASDQTSKASS